MKHLLTIVTSILFIACNETEINYECGKPDFLEHYFERIHVSPYDLSDRDNETNDISKYDLAVSLDLSYSTVIVEEGDGLPYTCEEYFYQTETYVDTLDHYNLYVMDGLEENRTNANAFFVLLGSRTTLQEFQDDPDRNFLTGFYLMHHDSVPQTLFVEFELISTVGDTLLARTEKIKLIP